MIQGRFGFLALGAAFLLLAAGCGGSASVSTPAATRSVSAAEPYGLTLTLSETAATIAPGGTVTFTLTLTNATATTVSGNVIVGCSDTTDLGQVNLLAPSGQSLTPIGPCQSAFSFPVTLAPGQSKSTTYSPGNVFTAPGEYTATGEADFSNASGTMGNLPNKIIGPLVVTVAS